MIQKALRAASRAMLTTCVIALWALKAEADANRGEVAIVFESGDQAVDAYRGQFTVPENRSRADSRQLTLTYVRFPATSAHAGPPIIYLAGGPGGSGIFTAKYRRFALFMALREFGDVIAFDQRGTGASDTLPTCESDVAIPLTTPTRDVEYRNLYRQAARSCARFWAKQGIDIYGYTTVENAADIDALRQHLGADKVSLWGISYGSHLALAALKQMEDRIDRVILASVEGLDQTVKLPARTDAYFDRLQAAINTDMRLAPVFPDIKGLMRRVHDRLDADPLLVMIPSSSGEPLPYLLQRRDMQQIASAMISDPARAFMMLGLYAEVDAGSSGRLAGLLERFITPGGRIDLRPMSTAMDVASGIDAARLELVRRQAETSLLADNLNAPMPHLAGVYDGLDLGDDFRSHPISDVPTLVLSGTLDGRTYPESQREAVSGLSKAQIVTIENAGHNLFMISPKITDLIARFMRGAALKTDHLRVDLPIPKDFGG